MKIRMRCLDKLKRGVGVIERFINALLEIVLIFVRCATTEHRWAVEYMDCIQRELWDWGELRRNGTSEEKARRLAATSPQCKYAYAISMEYETELIARRILGEHFFPMAVSLTGVLLWIVNAIGSFIGYVDRVLLLPHGAR